MTPLDVPTSEPYVTPDHTWLDTFRRRVSAWFRSNARDLPWRSTRDPYAIWVSEIMLQQTQVETVKPYFKRFLQRFPTIEALASSDESDVLRHWEGLGYYRRARQMHRAAQVLVAEHHGRFPADAQSIAALPGIGRYTTGAIMSFAFDRPEPILEANTIRLFSRLIGYREDPRRSAGQRRLWQFARDILPARGSGMINQGVMEIGSLVCTPNAPACHACPVAELCYARAHQLQDQIPRAAKRLAMEDVHEIAVVLRHANRVYLRQCQPGERWAGLWDYVRFPHPAQAAAESDVWSAIADCVANRTGILPEAGRHLTTIRHGVTRFRITLDCYVCELPAYCPADAATSVHAWVPVHELSAYALNTTGRRISQMLL